MLSNKFVQKGFTLIELIVVIAIVAVVASAALTSLGSFSQNTYLIDSTDQTLTLLRKAQARAINGLNGSNWSIEFDAPSDQLTLFRGDDYASRDQSFDQVLAYPESVDLNNVSLGGGAATALTFVKTSGTTTAGSFELTNGVDTQQFTINSLGQIDVQ